jgi:hypothetical protein
MLWVLTGHECVPFHVELVSFCQKYVSFIQKHHTIPYGSKSEVVVQRILDVFGF